MHSPGHQTKRINVEGPRNSVAKNTWHSHDLYTQCGSMCQAQIHSQKVCPSRCCFMIAGHSWASPWTVPCQMSSQLSSLIKRKLMWSGSSKLFDHLTKDDGSWSSLKRPLQAVNHTRTRTLFWHLWFTPSSECFWQNDFNGKVLGDLGYSFLMARALQVSTGYAQSVRVVISPTLLPHVRLHLNPTQAKQGWACEV